ncbi:hypothetical protein SDC9_122381 [bioreactor metagenome]|uniref:Uncharacterized protein n=1 Tax=bioreactor metagenome TaxID=1076179 RepID=A0A645CEI9_9ZZZZ
MANGYCMLHADRGPCSLPKICKLYPRAIRKGYIPECVCSCSCEKVVELLISSTAPLTFSSEQITIDPSDIPTCSYVLEGYKRDILYHCIGIMEDRSLKIKDRIIEIGKYITDKTGVQLEMYPDIFCFSSFSYSFIYAIKLISILGNVSRELKAYGFMCLKYLGVNTDKLDEYTIPDQTELEYASHKYTEALSHLETVLPDYPLYFEKILVNHMFYENFPFSDPKESPANTFVSFCAVYSLIKLTTACYMNDKSEKDDFTDSVSGIMHFIEHTSFYMNAEVIFRSFCVSSKVLINSLSDI